MLSNVKETLALNDSVRQINERMDVIEPALALVSKMPADAAETKLLKSALMMGVSANSQLTKLLEARANELKREAESLKARAKREEVEFDAALVKARKAVEALKEEIEGQSKAPAPMTAAEAAAKARAEEAASVERANAKAELERLKVPVHVRVSQVLKGGRLLGYGSRVERRAEGWEIYFKEVETKGGGLVVNDEHSQPIYVVQAPSHLVDGDEWAGWLYPCGSYTYTTVAGASKTVRKYATTVEAAYQEKHSQK